MILYLAKNDEALQIAEIHKAEIKKGFLSSLDVRFLESLYSFIIKSDFSFCVVAKEGDRVMGFAAGTLDINKLYLKFLKNHFFSSFAIFFPKILSPSFMKKIFETLLYPKKENDLPKAELLTIAIRNEFQNDGLGGKMLFLFISEMQKRGTKIFKVVVGEELKQAIKFYEKNGFKMLRNTTVHDRRVSRVYIYNL